MSKVSTKSKTSITWTPEDGRRLRERREKRGDSLAKVAAACDVSPSRIRECELAEHGGRLTGPSAELEQKLANYFGLKSIRARGRKR